MQIPKKLFQSTCRWPQGALQSLHCTFLRQVCSGCTSWRGRSFCRKVFWSNLRSSTSVDNLRWSKRSLQGIEVVGPSLHCLIQNPNGWPGLLIRLADQVWPRRWAVPSVPVPPIFQRYVQNPFGTLIVLHETFQGTHPFRDIPWFFPKNSGIFMWRHSKASK